MRPDSAQPANAPPAELYVHVVNWARFQHYGKPRPAWIKNHGSLLHQDAYLRLSPIRRALLHGLWLEYAASCSCPVVDAEFNCTCLGLHVDLLNRRLGLAAKMRDYEALNHAGFLTFHSRESLEKLYSDSRLEVETETEVEKRSSKAGIDDALSPPAAEAYRTLRKVAKPGYAEVKFTVARFATLAAKYPSLDLADQAERLADWERYGKGETRQTRDGIVAFRNWLDKAAAPSPNGHVAEVDYPWLPGCEPKRP